MKTILAATDFSERAERALQRAEGMARLSGAKIVFFHAVDDDAPREMVDAQAAIAERALGERAARNGTTGITTQIARGDPFVKLNEAVIENEADLIVVGDHRRSMLRAMFLDTTVERLIRIASVPVLIARAPNVEPYRHAIVGIEAEPADALIRTVESLGDAAPAQLTLVHAFDPLATGKMVYAGVAREKVEDYKKTLAQEIRHQIDSTRRRAGRKKHELIVVEGDADVVLESEASRLSADLIVTLTHARKGLARLVLGSVTSRLLRDGHIDLLIIPPPVLEAAR